MNLSGEEDEERRFCRSRQNSDGSSGVVVGRLSRVRVERRRVPGTSLSWSGRGSTVSIASSSSGVGSGSLGSGLGSGVGSGVGSGSETGSSSGTYLIGLMYGKYTTNSSGLGSE